MNGEELAALRERLAARRGRSQADMERDDEDWQLRQYEGRIGADWQLQYDVRRAGSDWIARR